MLNAKKIYGFKGEDYAGMVEGIALAEDGRVIAYTISKTVRDIPFDLGMAVGSRRKHTAYDLHYPEGWVAEWVSPDKEAAHKGLQAALKKLVSMVDLDDDNK